MSEPACSSALTHTPGTCPAAAPFLRGAGASPLGHRAPRVSLCSWRFPPGGLSSVWLHQSTFSLLAPEPRLLMNPRVSS